MPKDKRELTKRITQLTDNFIIGTAASAHQVEGNTDNDWTRFEGIKGNIKNEDRSGRATDHFNLYENDFSTLSKLGFQAHRLSIEWSRIVPRPNEVNTEAIEHYRQVLTSLNHSNQIGFVTLHHFTSPVWFIELGGFEKEDNLSHWEFFVRTICESLGDVIDVFNTINEPFVYAATGYLQGIHSPGKKSLIKYFKVGNNLIKAHYKAVKLIRKYCPKKRVGIVKNLLHFRPSLWWSPIDQLISLFSDWGYNTALIKALKKKKLPFGFGSIEDGDIGDFIGINYYVHMTVGLFLPDFMLPHKKGDTKLTQMGWGVNPESMKKEIKRIWDHLKVPIFITENGIATDDDEWRVEFVQQHLEALVDLMEEGIDIRGYFYWSNIDNFEWAEGYEPRFGLISFDEETFERQIKASAYYLGNLAKEVGDASNPIFSGEDVRGSE